MTLEKSIPDDLPLGMEMIVARYSCVRHLPFVEQIKSAGGVLTVRLDGKKIIRLSLENTYAAAVVAVSKTEVKIKTWGASDDDPTRTLIFDLETDCEFADRRLRAAN